MGWFGTKQALKPSGGRQPSGSGSPTTAVTIYVDVAACIRWAGVAVALVVLAWSHRGGEAAVVFESAIGGRTSAIEAATAAGLNGGRIAHDVVAEFNNRPEGSSK